MPITRSKPTSATPGSSWVSSAPALKRQSRPASLNALTPLDFRAFMSARRDSGTGSRSLARTLSALRSFFRFLERTGALQNRSVLAVALPKLPPRLPKPLTEMKAKDVVDEAGLDGELSEQPWTGPRNQAVLLLLYGSGLRISEALGLNRKDGRFHRATCFASRAKAAGKGWRPCCPSRNRRSRPIWRSVLTGSIRKARSLWASKAAA